MNAPDPALHAGLPAHLADPAEATAASEAPPPPRARSGTATIVLATLAVIAALWWGQRFLVPLAAGVMLAMLLMPLTTQLEAWLHSGLAATVLSLALAIGTLAAGALAFGGQLVRVAERVPEMISMAAQQLAESDTAAVSVLSRARDALQQLDRAADRLIATKPVTRPGRRPAATPAANLAASDAPNLGLAAGATVALRETAVSGSSALMSLGSNLAIILFIAFFVLSGGQPLAARFLGLWTYDHRVHHNARLAMFECARQTRLYAGVLLVTNTSIGIAVWAAFAVAGLPDAAGWGVTAAVLHVVPYLGMALLTVLGAAEAFLAHESIGAALAMAGYLVLMSTLIGTLVAAWLQGRAAKMNPAAVFIGLMFWSALWGIWGLFLGPALVVLLKVVAEHSRWGTRLARLMQG